MNADQAVCPPPPRAPPYFANGSGRLDSLANTGACQGRSHRWHARGQRAPDGCLGAARAQNPIELKGLRTCRRDKGFVRPGALGDAVQVRLRLPRHGPGVASRVVRAGPNQPVVRAGGSAGGIDVGGVATACPRHARSATQESKPKPGHGRRLNGPRFIAGAEEMAQASGRPMIVEELERVLRVIRGRIVRSQQDETRRRGT